MLTRTALLLIPPLALGPGCGPTTGDDDDSTEEAADPPRLSLPVLDPAKVAPPVVGFDHDPEDHDGAYQVLCTDYDGRAFPHCYDGHDGSDFMLDGGFDAMDN
ncbi:MAG: hypothetical protein QGH45_11145, partial [Myxococcota bacterium]|nr:hypothetical protein [Myxococcota bacterium]